MINEEMQWSFVVPLENYTNIDEVQNNFKILIPKELVKLIKQNNGGYPKKNKHCSIDGFGETDFKCLLSFNKNDDDNIFDSLEYFINKYNGMLIPFAIDSGSGYYCISDKGIIFFSEADEKTYYIANDINEFFKILF